MKYVVYVLAVMNLLAADPAADIASFKVAEGFEVSLFASEKEGVVKPIQMRFDSAGRLWVIGSTVYPQLKPGEQPNDKVIILEDRNEDGAADLSKVYADGLMIPTGLEIGAGGIYLGHGTELLFLPDANRDDKADAKIPVLRGFGTGDNHQNINSFAWSDAGHLWMCQGLHTLSRVETPWGISEMNQAGLWRFRPELKKLDPFYGSVYEPQNPWGYVFTDWGEPITIAGNNHSIMYPVPGLTSSHFPLAPKLIWRNGNGRKCSGGDIVGNGHFPEEWQGKLILGGYINNAIWSVSIVEDGAGFALEDFEPLITTTNRSFRPVDVKFGPDGALYVCDWYNPIIGHYQASFRHPDRDKAHGRIWRIMAKGRPLDKNPGLNRLPSERLVHNLTSSNRWVRHFSRRELIHRGNSVTNLLKGINSDFGRKQALGIYQAHEVQAPELIAQLVKAQQPGARAYAASAIGLWAEQLPEGLAWLCELAADEHPRVRLHAIVAASYYPKSEAVEALYAASKFPTDAFLDYAMRQSVFALRPVWTGNLNKLSDSVLAWLVSVDGSSEVLPAIRDIAKQGAPLHLLKIMAEQGTDKDIDFLLRQQRGKLTELLPVIVKSVEARNLPAPAKVGELLQSLAAEPLLKGYAYVLAGLWKVAVLREEITKEALSSKQAEAIRALGGYGDVTTLEKLTESDAAIEALAKLDLQKAAQAAANRFAGSDSNLLVIFLERKNGGKELAKALANKQLPEPASREALNILNRTGKNEPELSALFMSKAGIGKLAIPSDFAGQVAEHGDARKGKVIYERPELACVTCHKVNGIGGNIGPELSALGSAQPVDFIIGAVIEPQREIKEGFNSYLLTLKNGDEHQGYIMREDANGVLLRDTLWNEEVLIRKANIAASRNNGSLMPAGLVDTLTLEEFRDLVKYLSTLGRQ